MKKIMYLAMCAVLSACSVSWEDVPSQEEGEATLNFTVNDYTFESLDATRSTLSSTVNYLALGIYDADTKTLYTDVISQTASDDDFGSFNVTLPYGTYTLVFVGYVDSYEINMDDPENIYFTNTKTTDFFSKSMTLTVNSETTTQQSITLKRAVAKFSVVITDALPETVATCELIVEGGSYALNALTGYAPSATSVTRSITVASSALGTQNYSPYTRTFLLSDESTMNFTMTFYDSSGAVVASREFKDVPMAINQHTRYTGKFFNDETSFNIALETADWTTAEYTY